jgi:hypothetical protein
VIFGTKCPSITSICKKSAFDTDAISFFKSEKSAASNDGAIFNAPLGRSPSQLALKIDFTTAHLYGVFGNYPHAPLRSVFRDFGLKIFAINKLCQKFLTKNHEKHPRKIAYG